MKLTAQPILGGKALLFTLNGKFDPQGIVEAARERYADPQYPEVRAYIWDVRNVELPETPEVRESARQLHNVRTARNDMRPAIIVVDRIGSAQFGVARMWQNTFVFPMQIVDSMEKALEIASDSTMGEESP